MNGAEKNILKTPEQARVVCPDTSGGKTFINPRKASGN